MKLELKENMYIRTKDGYISQYKYYDTTNMGKLLCIPLNNKTFANIEDIVKASYNIIDILEEGDIIIDSVEKHEILLIDGELMVRNTGLIYDDNYYLPIKSITIKSVITHEQMEQINYKLGE